MSNPKRLAEAQGASWALMADIAGSAAADIGMEHREGSRLLEEAAYCRDMAEGWQTAVQWLEAH
jgi:hypothetical protein